MFDPEAVVRRKAVRPRPAATLILVRRFQGAPQVLMGRRAATHKFMPNKYVFPGGRVDASDLRVRTACALTEDTRAKLELHVSPAQARGFALAAIRETFEEAGLMIARPAPSFQTRAPAWKPFADLALEPDLSALTYIARAITPPYRDRRFDTRFFIADADALVSHDVRGSGELLALEWMRTSEAREQDLPNITRRVLDDIEARLSRPNDAHGIPYFSFRRGKALMEVI